MVCILIIAKADFPSGKSTPKSVKSKIKDSPTTISQATPQQTPEKVDCEITSKPTPRRSPRLTPKVLDVQFSCDERVLKKRTIGHQTSSKKPQATCEEYTGSSTIKKE